MTDTYRLPYGTTELEFELSGDVSPEMILPREVEAHPNPETAVKEALHNPVGSPALGQLDPGREFQWQSWTEAGQR